MEGWRVISDHPSESLLAKRGPVLKITHKPARGVSKLARREFLPSGMGVSTGAVTLQDPQTLQDTSPSRPIDGRRQDARRQADAAPPVSQIAQAAVGQRARGRS